MFHVANDPGAGMTLAASPLVSCRSLSMRYPGAASATLSDVELDVDAGALIAIVGRSGSGKSTLLNLLGAMDVPTGGTVQVDGCALETLSEAARTDFRRTRLGFVFQNFNLVPVLTVAENLGLPLALNGIDAPARVTALLAALELEHRLAAYPETLSGGEQQRVAIGRALIHRPALVLADEPTGNLDQETSASVLGLLREQVRAHRAALVMATHSMEAAQLADAVYQLRGGRLERVS